MKALIWLSSPLGLIYASLRVEWVGIVAGWLFLTGAVLLVFISLYRHFAANRLL